MNTRLPDNCAILVKAVPIAMGLYFQNFAVLAQCGSFEINGASPADEQVERQLSVSINKPGGSFKNSGNSGNGGSAQSTLIQRRDQLVADASAAEVVRRVRAASMAMSRARSDKNWVPIISPVDLSSCGIDDTFLGMPIGSYMLDSGFWASYWGSQYYPSFRPAAECERELQICIYYETDRYKEKNNMCEGANSIPWFGSAIAAYCKKGNEETHKANTNRCWQEVVTCRQDPG